MRDYINFLENIFGELLKLPQDKFNKKMDEISSPTMRDFFLQFKLSDEPALHCYPTPQTYMKLAKELDGK